MLPFHRADDLIHLAYDLSVVSLGDEDRVGFAGQYRAQILLRPAAVQRIDAYNTLRASKIMRLQRLADDAPCFVLLIEGHPVLQVQDRPVQVQRCRFRQFVRVAAWCVHQCPPRSQYTLCHHASLRSPLVLCIKMILH